MTDKRYRDEHAQPPSFTPLPKIELPSQDELRDQLARDRAARLALPAMTALVGLMEPASRIIRIAEALTRREWSQFPALEAAVHDLDKAMEFARQVKAKR